MSCLYLIPTSIHEESPGGFCFPEGVTGRLRDLRLFFVEEEKTARRSLKKIIPGLPLQECRLFPINEHTRPDEVKRYFREWVSGDAGLVSEAGCPCVADPGSDLVLLAHQKGIEIIPLVGPCSILLALMASGLSGQRFVFHGYLPREQEARIKAIRDMEKQSGHAGQTQIFMETPYRNEALWRDLLAHCQPGTLLCLAVDLGGPAQSVKTQTVAGWKKNPGDIHKHPAIFLLSKI